MSVGLFAGLDVSTQSTKLVVIDPEQSGIIFTDTVNYDTDLPQYRTKNGIVENLDEGASESDPAMWVDAVHNVFRKAVRARVELGKIRCIAVSGQQHGLVSLDAEGNLTRPRCKLWNDFSTLAECDILTGRVGGLDSMIREVGNSQRTGYTAPKIFHMLRHEPETYRRTATFFLVHNYINWFLTGAKDGGVRVMEPGDTSGMALWNPASGQWSEKVLRAIDPRLAEKLPPVRSACHSIGKISASLVREYGFSADCLVDAGSGDNMYGAIGTGNVRAGIVTVSLGTSGTAYTYLEKPFIDPAGEIAAFCDSTGHFLPLLCVSNLANGYNALIDQYKIGHEEFDEIVGTTNPGNGGRILIPWYVGERTPDVPLAAPTCFGFGLGDFSREILCRAVLEGHVLNLYEGFRQMPVESKEIRLTGGLSKSEAWCQIIADVFEADAVPVEGEGAALGAALHAAWVWMKESGHEKSIEEVVNPFVILDEKRRKKPIAANVAKYRVQKQLFSALSRRLRGKEGADPFALRSQMIEHAQCLSVDSDT
jgi:xylulokinase